jgi:hypothetical protein
MTQGTITVVQYERHFMKMMRYAKDDVRYVRQSKVDF